MVDGQRGELIIAGFPIEELARMPPSRKRSVCSAATAWKREIPRIAYDVLGALPSETMSRWMP